MIEVDVVIPCFNEEISIEETIRSVRNILPSSRILVVDNNSTDKTALIARSAGAEVIFEARKGKGFAVARGFNEIRTECEVIVMLDGDATYSTLKLEEIVNYLVRSNLDIVVGTRVTQPKTNALTYRRLHVFGNRFFRFINRYVLGLDVQDPLSGYRVMSRRFVKSFSGGASQFEIEAELNAHARTLSCKVVNIDVDYKGRLPGSESKLRTLRDGIKILIIYMRQFYEIRPIRAYTFTAFPFATLGTILVWRALSTYLISQRVPNFPSLIVGVGFVGFSINLLLGGVILSRMNNIQKAFVRERYNNL